MEFWHHAFDPLGKELIRGKCDSADMVRSCIELATQAFRQDRRYLSDVDFGGREKVNVSLCQPHAAVLETVIFCRGNTRLTAVCLSGRDAKGDEAELDALANVMRSVREGYVQPSLNALASAERPLLIAWVLPLPPSDAHFVVEVMVFSLHIAAAFCEWLEAGSPFDARSRARTG